MSCLPTWKSPLLMTSRDQRGGTTLIGYGRRHSIYPTRRMKGFTFYHEITTKGVHSPVQKSIGKMHKTCTNQGVCQKAQDQFELIQVGTTWSQQWTALATPTGTRQGSGFLKARRLGTEKFLRGKLKFPDLCKFDHHTVDPSDYRPLWSRSTKVILPVGQMEGVEI